MIEIPGSQMVGPLVVRLSAERRSSSRRVQLNSVPSRAADVHDGTIPADVSGFNGYTALYMAISRNTDSHTYSNQALRRHTRSA